MPARPRRQAAPRLMLTLGIHGSASTWVFNVVRELLAEALGAECVFGCFANSAEQLLGQRESLGRTVVCKLHGWPNLDVFAHLASASVVLSVRDPRDCVVSMMQRFGAALPLCARAVAQDFQHATWCAGAGHPVLRYEDAFFAKPATVTALARHLGVAIDPEATARIFAAYRTETVRDFAAGVPDLPPGRLEGDGAPLLFDRITQIHRTHIGDARAGKWRDQLGPQQQAELTRYFAPFLARFGYPAE